MSLAEVRAVARGRDVRRRSHLPGAEVDRGDVGAVARVSAKSSVLVVGALGRAPDSAPRARQARPARPSASTRSQHAASPSPAISALRVPAQRLLRVAARRRRSGSRRRSSSPRAPGRSTPRCQAMNRLTAMMRPKAATKIARTWPAGGLRLISLLPGHHSSLPLKTVSCVGAVAVPQILDPEADVGPVRACRRGPAAGGAMT